MQRQKKCTTILSEYIDSLASTEGENVLIYLVLLSLEDTPPKQNLKWRINVYSQLKFSQNCQKSFWNNEGFFCLLSPCFWFLKLMVRISTQGNYSEEQLCGIEELIKFYVDFFHYEHSLARHNSSLWIFTATCIGVELKQFEISLKWSFTDLLNHHH